MYEEVLARLQQQEDRAEDAEQSLLRLHQLQVTPATAMNLHRHILPLIISARRSSSAPCI